MVSQNANVIFESETLLQIIQLKRLEKVNMINDNVSFVATISSLQLLQKYCFAVFSHCQTYHCGSTEKYLL